MECTGELSTIESGEFRELGMLQASVGIKIVFVGQKNKSAAECTDWPVVHQRSSVSFFQQILFVCTTKYNIKACGCMEQLYIL